MKTGRSLQELAAELDRQQKTKRDYLADTRALTLSESGDNLRIDGAGTDGSNLMCEITPHCHRQIATRLKIPQQYYDRMRTDAPDLLAKNVNAWFERKPEKRMVRTLDGHARAFLSDRYRPLDNYDLALATLPKLQEMFCQVRSAELTDHRFYIQAVTERIQMEVTKGDIVQAGIAISNSEVGLGGVQVDPLIFRLICLNGMIAPDVSLRKYHVGRSGADQGLLDGAAEFFRDETRMLDDRAFFAKVQDVVAAALDEVKFGQIVGKLQASVEKRIEGDPIKAVEVAAKRLDLGEQEQGNVLRHLIEGGDLSQYGLSNAITRTAEDVDSYDRAIDLERVGGLVIELGDSDWKAVATAK